MNYFNQQNTENYTAKQLAIMNSALEQLLINDLGENYLSHDDYDHYSKNYGDQIFNKYCNVEKFQNV